MMPWMVYNFILLVTNTAIFIFYAVEYIAKYYTTYGVVHIGLALIYFCK